MNCHCITSSLRKSTEKTLREKLPTGQSFGYYKGWYTWNIESRKRLKLYTDSWASRNSLSVWSVSSVQFSSVAVMSDSLWSHGVQHARPPCPAPTPRVYSNSCLLNWWCHPTISSSVVPFSPLLQSFPASGSFPMSQLFMSGGQSSGVSPSTSVLPKNIQDWSPLGWTGWISLQSKGLSRVFSNTTVQKHQFFSAQVSLKSSSHIHTWLLEKP